MIIKTAVFVITVCQDGYVHCRDHNHQIADPLFMMLTPAVIRNEYYGFGIQGTDT